MVLQKVLDRPGQCFSYANKCVVIQLIGDIEEISIFFNSSMSWESDLIVFISRS